MMELHQFRQQLSYDGDISPCDFLYSIGQSIFESESGNENVDRQVGE